MSKRIVEELAWLRILFVVAAAVDISLLGWIAQHYAKAGAGLFGLALVVLVAVSGGIVMIGRSTLHRLTRLEE